MDGERPDRTRIATGILLIAQAVLFLVSISSFMAISAFCSITTGNSLSFITIVHFAYLGLFIFGVASLFFWRLGRKIYIAAIIVALMALPVQLWLLENGYLRCDGP